MALMFMCDGEPPEPWRASLCNAIPDLDFRIWPDNLGNVDEIDIALAWQPPRGALANFSNLKFVLSLGAGVEHILCDPGLPKSVRIARLIEPGLRTGMVEFVTMEVLRYHRRADEYRFQQSNRKWKLLGQTLSQDRRVGILGLGYLGAACGDMLRRFGFSVSGWARSAKTLPGIDSFYGEDGLFSLLEQSDILICLLPLTSETEDILDATTLGALPRGAVLINVARGEHLIDEDLINALDSGQLSAATLDVFREEPLPFEHPFWMHPKISLFPHAAAWTFPESATPVIADNIRRCLAGEKLVGEIEPKRGY